MINNNNKDIQRFLKNISQTSMTIPIDNDTFKIPKKNLFKWIGGKSWLSNKLYKEFDFNTHNKIYIEPFIGGLGSFKSIYPLLIKYKYEKIILNDINSVLISTYKMIKDKKSFNIIIDEYRYINEEYISLYDNIPKLSYKIINGESIKGYYTYDDLHVSKDKEELKKTFLYQQNNYFKMIKSQFNKEKKIKITESTVAKFLFLMKHCFNGIYRENQKGEYNVPFNWGNSYEMSEVRISVIKEYHKFFNDNKIDIIFENMDVFSLLKKYNNQESTLYLDPPYLNKDSELENRYNKNIFSVKEQFELIKEIEYYNSVMYSNHYDNRLINIMDKWNIMKVYRKNIMSSKSENRKNNKEELLAIYNK